MKKEVNQERYMSFKPNNKEAIGIVGFDYILGPTAHLTFALKQEYWNKGIMQTVLNDFLSKYTKLYKNIIVRGQEKTMHLR